MKGNSKISKKQRDRVVLRHDRSFGSASELNNETDSFQSLDQAAHWVEANR